MGVSTSATRSAAAATLTLVLAACGASSHATAPPTAANLFSRLVADYVAYARCARTHGMPNLPDPQVDPEGNDHYPALDRQGSWRWPQSVLTGCATVWERVHAIRDQYDSTQRRPPESAATRAQQVAIARCIRAHGFPSFPDPDPSGGYPIASLPPGFAKPNLSPQARAILAACGRRRSG